MVYWQWISMNVRGWIFEGKASLTFDELWNLHCESFQESLQPKWRNSQISGLKMCPYVLYRKSHLLKSIFFIFQVNSYRRSLHTLPRINYEPCRYTKFLPCDGDIQRFSTQHKSILTVLVELDAAVRSILGTHMGYTNESCVFIRASTSL